MKRRPWLFLALGLLLLGALKFAAFDWYQQHQPQSQSPPAKALLTPIACAQGAASCALPGGGRLLFLEPPVEGRAFVMALEGVTAKAPSAEFSMRSMDMGFNQYRFVRAHGRWEASVILPACVSGRRDWEMTLNLDGQRYLLPLSVR